MSAWLCSEEHINLLASFADDPTATFGMLVNENLRSLEARYPGRDFLEEWKQEAANYRFKPEARNHLTDKRVATLVLKQCDCFDYQACESDDYKTTPAAKYIETVRAQAKTAGAQSKGKLYDGMPWGID